LRTAGEGASIRWDSLPVPIDPGKQDPSGRTLRESKRTLSGLRICHALGH
jgi:hypothetical protein